MRAIHPILATLGAVAVLSYCIPAKQTVSKRSPINVMMQKAIGIAKACRVYYVDHEGKKLPPKLPDLIGADGFTREQWDESRYVDPESGKPMDWLYFPMAIAEYENAGHERLFIASPIPHKGRRIAVFADSTAQIVTSEEFEKLERKAVERTPPSVPDRATGR